LGGLRFLTATRGEDILRPKKERELTLGRLKKLPRLELCLWWWLSPPKMLAALLWWCLWWRSRERERDFERDFLWCLCELRRVMTDPVSQSQNPIFAVADVSPPRTPLGLLGWAVSAGRGCSHTHAHTRGTETPAAVVWVLNEKALASEKQIRT
jgi:hypothetical protein